MVCIALMSLLVLIGVGFLGMASVELGKSPQAESMVVARANARMALMLAIGQLQRTMGPDQRISACADILNSSAAQPNWVGTWRTTLANGAPMFTRDDLNGGLHDVRWEQRIGASNQVIEWLVSGSDNPLNPTWPNTVTLMRVLQNGHLVPVVQAPKVSVVGNSGKPTGNYAWWTGDLGVRANIATLDPRSSIPADCNAPSSGGLYRVMSSQVADMAMMQGGVALPDSQTKRLASPAEIALTDVGGDWAAAHALDYTTFSMGVLADAANGGLKRDLTAYFQSGGQVPGFANLTGITDNDPLVGAGAVPGDSRVNSRYQVAAPRFGLLRNWATCSVPFSNALAATQLTDMDPSAGANTQTFALANGNPVKLSGNQSAGLQPILVEATNFTQMSSYQCQSTPQKIYQIRELMYPRVVLWNPYNMKLKFSRAIVMIQGNGRKEMWTNNLNVNNLPNCGPQFLCEWLNFEGGRSTNFGNINDVSSILSSQGYNDQYIGSYYFSIPETTFQPGECLVFSPARCQEYDGLSAYRPGPYNLDNNELTCQLAPDPSRCYYVSASDINDNLDFLPVAFWYAPTVGWVLVNDQSSDTRAIMKQVTPGQAVTFESFDALPQICVLSASLQYGSGREPRMAWSSNEQMPMQLLDMNNPKPTLIPNVRTRESIRMRWFFETPSNLDNSGYLNGTPYFEEALLANWNPRASFIVRSPWENIGGDISGGGVNSGLSCGGPWFFGAYTRDLFDQAVSWEDQVPVPRNGTFHGNPFGQPQDGLASYVLFDVPRNETGLVSLGQLQHVKLSEFVWHPTYAIGNSLADPRLGAGSNTGLARTSPVPTSTSSSTLGGFGVNEIGWSTDPVQSPTRDAWAAKGRAVLENVPTTDNLVYDLSFEVNRTLWDRYFLSSGSVTDKQAFLQDPVAHPLPNGRMRLAPCVPAPAVSDLTDFFHSSMHLMVDGAFNVNSTRVEAWKAMLGCTGLCGYSSARNVPFPRVLNAPGGVCYNGDSLSSNGVWSGWRELTPGEIDSLAQAIVDQVRLRGPFISLADFVNRRLAEDPTGRMGALQAAIENANLNSGLNGSLPLNNQKSLPGYVHPDHIANPTSLDQTLKPSCKAWGAPGYLTQADLLQVLGPSLSARSDTFIIRTYGDALDASGKVQAQAWCEAVVQRIPQPLTPDVSGLNSSLAGQNNDFGRRFVIASFRWISPGEI